MNRHVFTLIFAASLLFCGISYSQSLAVKGTLAKMVMEKKQQYPRAAVPDLFQATENPVAAKRSAALVSHSGFLSLKPAEINNLLQDPKELIELTIPFEDSILHLDLFKSQPVSPDFKVTTSEGQIITKSAGVHYRGILSGDDQSIVALSVYEGHVMGMVSSSQLGNVVIGRWKDANDLHVIYRESDLQIENEFSCDAPLAPNSRGTKIEGKDFSRSGMANCVKVYFETSYGLFQNKNSDASEVINFVTGFFNQVSTIYANENINIEISDIFVWTTPDPYNHGNSSDALDSFMAGRPDFNGDLGHFVDISGNGNGGRAYIDVICSSSHNVGYSDISSSYSGFPTYSWTVNVIAHELGHNFGSYHTQDCIWGPENCTSIDGCVASSPSTGCGTCEVGPIPDKGTIMSYCHLNSGNGIDFNLGFGPEPGNLIRSRVNAANCLSACGGGGGSSGCNLVLVSITKTDANCDNHNGTVTVNISGSSGTVTYDIGNGPQTSNIFTNLAPGDYNIIVKNGSGCEKNGSASISMLSSAPQLKATVTNATCGADDGNIALQATAGSAPYSYRIGSTTQSDPVFSGMAAGEYIATVTDDNGCSTDKAIQVFSESAPSLAAKVDHTSCGLDNGQLDLVTYTGTGPFTYSVGNLSSKSGLFENLAPGSYTARVLDVNGCTDSKTVNIDASDPITATLETTDTKCASANGTISINASGGSGAFTYSIGEGFNTSPNFTEVAAGSYEAQIKDGSGCIMTLTATVGSSQSFEITTDVQATTCGLANGSVQINAAGSSGYSYKINSGNFGASSDFDELASGIYEISARDATGCVVTSTVEVPSSTNPQITARVDDTHCGLNNGSIETTIKNGVAPYLYKLADGSPQEENFFKDLEPAAYQIIVVDANDCTDTMLVSIDSSETLLAQIDATPTFCGKKNGSIQIEPVQGIAPFTFEVGGEQRSSGLVQNVPAGMTTIVVRDADFCTFETAVEIESSNAIEMSPVVQMTSCGLSNGQINIDAEGGTGTLLFQFDTLPFSARNDFSDLAPGNYKIAIRDEQECMEDTILLVASSTNPQLDLETSNTSCGQDNGRISLKAQKGLAPYEFFVNDSLVFEKDLLMDLSAGEYQITVVDSQKCVDSSLITIQNSSSPEILANVSPASCAKANGSIELSGIAGTGPYIYSIGEEYLNDGLFLQIDSGQYLVSLRDSLNCLDTMTVQVSYDDQFKAPILPAETSLCEGQPTLLSTGIANGIDLNWSLNDVILDSKEPNLEVLESGRYTARVTYHDQCILETSSMVITRPTPVQTFVSADTICLGDSFRIDQYNPDYHYTWNNDSVGPSVIFRNSGEYVVEVTNSFNCVLSLPLNLEVIQPLHIETAKEHLSICAGDEVTLTVSGAKNYTWDYQGVLVESQNGILNVSPEEMTVYTVMGYNACFSDALQISVEIYTNQFALADTQIIEGAPLYLDLEGSSDVKWGGDFFIDCIACNNPTIRPTLPGKVFVDYVDQNSCHWRDSATIDVIPLEDVLPMLVNVISPNGDGKNDVLKFDGLDAFGGVALKVFNQDGNIIYESREYTNDWGGTYNGETLPEGIYFYVLEVLLDERVFQMDSDLTLVRD